MSKDFIIVIDEGTTGVRSFVYNKQLEAISTSYKSLKIHYPEDLSYECDASEIYAKVVEVCEDAVKKANIKFEEVASVAITMQRVTWLLWDKTTGKPLRNSVVWLDKRAVRQGKKWADDPEFKAKFPNGKALSPISVAVFVKHFKDTEPEFKKEFDKGNFLFGTIESYIMWMLTKGKTHATVRSNVCVGTLWDIAKLEWDKELIEYVGINFDQLPELKNEIDDFGVVDKSIFGEEIPIYGVIADQQAALFSQCGTKLNSVKCTNGTGSFIDVNVGEIYKSAPPLFSLVAWSIDDKITYAIEGVSATAGVCLEWAKNNLELFDEFDNMETQALSIPKAQGLYFIPTFLGSKMPVMDFMAKGALFGITASVQKQHIIRAMLESLGFAVSLIVKRIQDEGVDISVIRMSGGVSKSSILCQMVADVINVDVELPKTVEATAMGAAILAAIKLEWATNDDCDKYIAIEKVYRPSEDREKTLKIYDKWVETCERVTGLQTL